MVGQNKIASQLFIPLLIERLPNIDQMNLTHLLHRCASGVKARSKRRSVLIRPRAAREMIDNPIRTCHITITCNKASQAGRRESYANRSSDKIRILDPTHQ